MKKCIYNLHLTMIFNCKLIMIKNLKCFTKVNQYIVHDVLVTFELTQSKHISFVLEYMVLGIYVGL